MKKWLFAFCFISSILSSTLWLCYLTVRGGMQAGQAIVLYAILFVVAMLMAIACQKKYTTQVRKVVLSVSVLAVLFLFTVLFNEGSNSNTVKFFELFIINSVSSIMVAYCFVQNQIDRRCVDTMLPFLIFPLTVIVGMSAFTFATQSILFDEDTALNYQNISYAIAEIYAMCAYYYFFSSVRSTRLYKLIKYPVLMAMVACVFICLMSGGRGGFLYLLIVSGVLLFLLYRAKRISVASSLIYIGIGCALFVYFADQYNVFDTRGFSRLSENLTDDSARRPFYEAASQFFIDSPLIGHGPGSVFYTVGFYCHNMFYDIAVDMGIVGLILAFFIIVRLFKSLYKFIIQDYFYVLLSLLFLKSFTMSMFSGYWMSNGILWFFIALVYIYPQNVRNGKVNLQDYYS